MNTKTKVVFNTAVLYAKIIVSMAISLVSVPLVLKALGASDYGLYNLVAGVVAMLAFLNNSMTVSTQRYMSVAMGANDDKKVNIVYNTSFRLHLFLAILVFFLLEIGAFFIEKLNISPDRLQTAQIIYQLLVFTTICKILSVPFDAIMNAHEDMLAFSVIELIDSFLLLSVAFTLQSLGGDRLLFYGVAVLLIAILTLGMKYLWSHFKYKNYTIYLHQDKGQLQTKEMFSFAGWNLFGSVSLIGRNQGVAIIINLFLGTVTNAAYGIAHQINGALSNFSSTFQRAINPQLMKSEGMGDRERLLRISYISSKYSVLALSFFAIPLIVEMADVLQIWLRDIPPFTMELSRCILLLSIAYQYSQGIASAIQAAGNIRNYQITMGLLILLNIPLSYLILSTGMPVYWVTIGYVLIECFSFIVRVLFARKLLQMKALVFIKEVLLPTSIIILIPFFLSLIPHYFIDVLWSRLILTCFVYGISYIMLTWSIGFDSKQRQAIIGQVIKLFNKS